MFITCVQNVTASIAKRVLESFIEECRKKVGIQPESGTGEPKTATDKLQKTTDSAISQGKETTDAAVSQGKEIVEQTKPVGAEYVEEVKGLAQSALDTAQVWFLHVASRDGN